ncbi:MAG: SEL1-like repeat protein [Oxalobacter sp.]|nr:SEL1-like repeat protein [Oxalobacter sp.]
MSESIKNLLKRAEQGDAQSQFLAGMLYENGLGIAKDEILAQTWYRKAAAQGHREAKQKLGETIKPSEQVTAETQNSQTQTENQYGSAMLWDIDWRYDYSSFTYERVIGDAKAGNAAAQYICGIIAYDADDYYGNREPSMGYGNYDRENISFEWNSKAAKQGHSGAQNNLGWWYKNGHGFLRSNKDYQKALDWFHKATRQGNPYAQYNLGLMYINGQGVLKDYQQAFTLFQDSATQGNQYAQYILGLMCANGHGTPQDLQLALDWFHRAAENNRKNQSESRDKALKEAAEKKRSEVKKQLEEEQRKERSAPTWESFSRKSEQKKTIKELLEGSGTHHSAEERLRMAQSAYMMARMSLQGTGTENARAAFEYMEYAAENGLAEAQCDLAILYSQGIGTMKDDAMAFVWFQKAADKGHPLAMHNVAAHYLNAYRNEQAAFQWYRKAAEAGHTKSQVVVALMYIKGTGVPQDMTQAIGWLQKAASQGSEEALQLLARLVL